MAERVLNLNNFKSSGVYTIEIDESENLALAITTGRLIIGSSRIGPFNTIVYIKDLNTLKRVYGDIDPTLEKNGSFFHRSIEVALREGPVFALNILPLDTNTDPNANLDKAYFTTFNTESSSNNEDTAPYQYPIVEFFNRQRLWYADDDQLNKSKNIYLGDDFINNPGGYGKTTASSNKILSFANTGKKNLTTWVRKSNVTGFDVTAKEWYASFGNSIDFPTFVHEDDLISDYFVDVIMVEGDWTDYVRLSKDPVYGQYFDSEGIIDSKIQDFLALREINTISQITGCLIPNFKDQSGNVISIDVLVNRLFPITGVLAALDVDKLDFMDLTSSAFIDNDVYTHRIDLIGHGYDELDSLNAYVIDDGGIDTDLTTPVDPTPLIDTLSYSKPGDSTLIYKVTQFKNEGDFTSVISSDIIEVTPALPATNTFLIAMEDSLLYKAYANGFIVNGDNILDGTNTYYIKIQDGFTVNIGGNEIKYVKVFIYQDASLLNQTSVNSYTIGPDTYIKLELLNGDVFKRDFDLTDTNFFTDYTILQPNVIKFGVNLANKAIIDEYFKVNHYIKAKVTQGRERLLKILSISSAETLSPYRLEYTVTLMAPSSQYVTGIDVTNNIVSVYKGIPNFVKSLKGQYLQGFKVRDSLLPNKTATRQREILQYLFDYTSIPQALSDKETIDYRYIVDTYEGEISSSSKYHLAKIAAMNGKAMAILNDPSFEQFEKSVEPSFIDPINRIVSSDLIAQGGNLSLNPSFTFKFAEEDVNGVPLSSYAYYVMPNLLIQEGGRIKSVPPAAYVSNAYVRKFKNGKPFSIVGGKNGRISDPEVVDLEYTLTNEDRDNLEPVGHNLLVKRRGLGITILSNNTGYQRVNSALNNAHVRDALSTIERDIESILFNFLFDFNDEITRIRVRTLLENYLDRAVNARGISSYSVTIDSTNNTNTVISANTAIVDVLVDFPRGIHKFINRITITKVGGELSSQSTGFTPSF